MIGKAGKPPVIVHSKKGLALLMASDMYEAENMIVIESNIVKQDAEQHIEKNEKCGYAGFLFHLMDIDRYMVKIKCADTPQQKFKLKHKIPLLSA
ncbi:MAG: hypothetical protein PUK20_00840 [Firmicutes bacterium]|nr:hypothetical protein [Bacillota bacterium]